MLQNLVQAQQKAGPLSSISPSVSIPKFHVSVGEVGVQWAKEAGLSVPGQQQAAWPPHETPPAFLKSCHWKPCKGKCRSQSWPKSPVLWVWELGVALSIHDIVFLVRIFPGESVNAWDVSAILSSFSQRSVIHPKSLPCSTGIREH